MSELSEAINEMRTMRESYDELSAAAEAYNTGKTELAHNITAKGVEASASETLPELAEKVSAIAQETYEINGGEMYAKQLFGSLETPNYWNLYDIFAQLLSDGRLVSYGGILLAEYYRGYDSLALSGAGAGGAYVVSDKDENGQFIKYDTDIVHTWATEFDGKGNRWVAYCFAEEYHDFQITNTNTSPRSIFIGRKVGKITCLVNTRISQIVVPDGNVLNSFISNSKSHNFGKNIVFRNIIGLSGLNTAATNECWYFDLHNPDTINEQQIMYNTSATACVIVNLNGGSLRRTGYNGFVTSNGAQSSYITTFIAYGIKKIEGTILGGFPGPATNIMFLEAEEIDTSLYHTIAYTDIHAINLLTEYLHGTNMLIMNSGVALKIRLGYIRNDSTKSVVLRTYMVNSITSFDIIQNDWLKPLNIAETQQTLSAENIAKGILARLGVCTTETGRLTLKLGATNLATIQNSEEYSSYLTDAIDNKNWNVIA